MKTVYTRCAADGLSGRAPAFAKTRHAVLVTLLCLGSGGRAVAQFDVQLPLMYGLQQTLGNPAALQDHGLTIGLPSAGAGGYLPLSVKEFGSVDAGVLRIDPTRALAALDPERNIVLGEGNVETLSLTIRSKRTQLGFGHAARVRVGAQLPYGLAELALKGNAAFVGQRVAVSPEVTAFGYQEFYVQFARIVGDKLTWGLRAKYLRGSGAVTMRGPGLGLFTSPDNYQLTVDADVDIRSAGATLRLEPEDAEFDLPEAYTGAGNGFGLDLGVMYRPMDKLEFGFAVRDLGLIRWSGGAATHAVRGSYTFEGIRGNPFEGDAPEGILVGFGDSLLAGLDIERTEGGFTTALRSQAQFTMRYRLARHTTAYGTLFGATTVGGVQGGLGVGLQQRFWEIGHLGLVGGVKAGGPFAGFHFGLDVLWTQVYVAVDNIAVGDNIANFQDAYVRAGVNLAFGKKKRGEYLRGWYDKRPTRKQRRALEAEPQAPPPVDTTPEP